MIDVSLFGAGRIGAIHAANLAAHPAAQLRYVVDVNAVAASELATRHGARHAERDAALNDPELDAVVIASTTNTHADLIIAAAARKLDIFCEKPIDLDRRRTQACLDAVKESGVVFSLGFNRRFDANFAALHESIRTGRIGDVEVVQITSRDPTPPPAGYLAGSGGMFKDMSIHDFDMARWLLGEEPATVHAMAACLVDPAIKAAGDIDTAVVMMQTASGKICHISNSRRAVYGYDQRIEVFGSRGMLRAENELISTNELFSEEGVRRDPLKHFFLDRYMNAYRRELQEFFDCLATGKAPSVTGEDGYRALVLAEAAQESVKTGRPVAV